MNFSRSVHQLKENDSYIRRANKHARINGWFSKYLEGYLGVEITCIQNSLFVLHEGSFFRPSYLNKYSNSTYTKRHLLKKHGERHSDIKGIPYTNMRQSIQKKP
jgi:hypothetical protein